jgi:glutamate formiminotransferase/formiminotetrahydrofolate cyclodeaminase
MQSLVECVPNFSEGRDTEKVRALIAAVTAVPGVFLLDQEMDHDHHRAVLTFAGTPEAVEEAAFQAAKKAVTLLDLRTHQGGHPRIGATDVIPFVPIRNVTMVDCVTLARRVGQRIGHELRIPVFLYEQAATQPDRANLETIRRGGLEALAHRMETEPGWAPDFGPHKLHPTAGATVVGARPALVAYNVNLKTTDKNIANAIAKTVRYSSGGLPHVKAIGVELASRGIVQVSMNLTNYEVTSIRTAFEAVRREAEQRSVEVLSSEIIGLVPQRALIQAAEASLRLERFDPTQVLETRLEMAVPPSESRASGPSVRDLSASVSDFLGAVAAGTPTPGGGSVAALAGALAAALGVMVCRLAEGQDKTPKRPVEGQASETTSMPPLAATRDRLVALSSRLKDLIQADAEAYEGVLRAYRLSKNDPQRATAIASSLQGATEVPLTTATLALEAAQLLRQVLPHIKPTMASDLKVGLLMALAAIEGGLENVIINLKALTNQQVIKDFLARVERIKHGLVEIRSL